jgi:hypothetical protein
VSCYLRHLDEVLREAGIELPPDRAARRRLDSYIADLVGDEGRHCPTTWRLVKERLADAEARRELVAGLRGFG